MTTEIVMINLEKFRVYHSMSLQSLCEYIGIGRSTLHNWRTGKNVPCTQSLEHIAGRLSVTLPELLDIDYSPEQALPILCDDDKDSALKHFQLELNKLNAEFSAFLGP